MENLLGKVVRNSIPIGLDFFAAAGDILANAMNNTVVLSIVTELALSQTRSLYSN